MVEGQAGARPLEGHEGAAATTGTGPARRCGRTTGRARRAAVAARRPARSDLATATATATRDERRRAVDLDGRSTTTACPGSRRNQGGAAIGAATKSAAARCPSVRGTSGTTNVDRDAVTR